jgi:hypothetical protein
MKTKLLLVLAAMLGATATVPFARAALFMPVVLRYTGTYGPLDQLLSTNGTPIAAANLGSTSNVLRNGVTFPAAGVGANPAGANWSAVSSTADLSLGGYATIDPLFFSEIWGGNPISVTVSNLNPAKTCLVQILHGEPRSCCGATFMTNDFLLPSGGSLPVPAFTLGNGIAGENPPDVLDRAIVEVELRGVTSFSYRMFAAATRGPSFAGFQVRELPEFTSAPVAGLPEVSDSSVAWGDYDNDGRIDFLLTGYTGSGGVTQLWRNMGGGFTVPAGLPARFYRLSKP